MRTVTRLLATAGAIAVLGAGGCGNAAANAAGVWVEVSPSTITAGNAVMVRASCGDNSNPATVSSPAFGTVTLLPQSSLLMATVTIPAHVVASTFDVTLTCKTGSTATTTLTVINASSSAAAPSTSPPPTVGPHTGGGFLARGGGSTNVATAWIAGGIAALAASTAIGISTRRKRRPAGRR